MENFQQYFQQYGITIITLIAMLGWFFVKAWPDFKQEIQTDPFGDYDEPGTASTLGVLGTFLGITIGLFFFDTTPAHMQESVVSLLGGMTTAFVTSLLGMCLSMYMKYKQTKTKKVASASKNNVIENATITDLIQVIQNQHVEQRQTNEAILEAMQGANQELKDTIASCLRKVRNSVAGDGEATVIGQMKIMRLETRDELNKICEESKESNARLIQEFRDFTKTMAENNAKSFIEALTETMKDFNTKLTEQFGENFKQLNVAVGRLLEWQEHYKETIEAITENQKIIFDGINEAKDSLKMVEEASKGMTESAAKMSELIVTANMFNERLDQALKRLDEISKNAKESIPNIENLVKAACENTSDLTDTAVAGVTSFSKSTLEAIVESVQKSGEATEKSIANASEKLQALTDSLHDISDKIQANNEKALQHLAEQAEATVRAISDVTGSITDSSNKLRENLEADVNATKESVRKAAESLSKSSLSVTQEVSNHLDEMMKTNNENLKKSSENLSRDLDNKITESLEDLGRAMAQITQKFAQDYTPLADRLREIVHIAEQLQQERRKR